MIKSFATLCVAAGLVQTLGLAQGPGRPRGGGVQMRVDFLTTQLSLTDSQKAQATAIFTGEYTASQSIRSDLQTNRQSIADAVKKNDIAAIDQLSNTAGMLSGQLTALESKAEA